MKPNRDAAALAASLTTAANAPLPLPERPVVPVPASAEPAPPGRVGKPKLVVETVGITLRPGRELLQHYTMAAAERTKKEGKVISAQQIMIEVLEREMRGKS